MELKVSIFTNAGTVPLELAAREGMFSDEGLSVEVVGTTSSIEQMTGVIDGRYDIAATAIDNVIAYNAGQGAAPTQNASELRVFMGSATYRLPFVVAPSIVGFSELRGKRIAVDALSTGFAFLLRDMLALNGLEPESYELVPTGAPRERWEAVRSRAVSGALLNAHFEALAHEEGCRTLYSDPDPWEGYQGNAFCAQSQFMAEGPVDSFIRAVLRGVEFALDPANRAAVAEALAAHLGGLTSDSAYQLAAELQKPDSILRKGLPLSLSGTRRVMELRERYTEIPLSFGTDSLFDSRARVLP